MEIDALHSVSDRHQMGVMSPPSNYDAAISARMPSQVGLFHSLTPTPTATYLSIITCPTCQWSGRGFGDPASLYGVGGGSSWKAEKDRSIKRSSRGEKMEEQEDLDVFMGEEEVKSSHDAQLSSLISAIEVGPDAPKDRATGPSKNELTTQVLSMP